MLFNSFHFLFFFIVITISYYSISHSYRWLLLLLASCYFYMIFVPIYILILGFTIVIDYFAGIFLESPDTKKRKIYLIISLIANIGVLAFFKYYNFLNTNLTTLLHGVNYQNPIPYLSILLPIGLSFHTFQAMSYTIEVYRGNQKAERHFGIYALYVMFYPQLVAGPIERPQNLLWQFRKKVTFDAEKVSSGLKLMAWGAFKKMIIADRIAPYVSEIYSNPHSHTGFPLLLAAILFSIQIFCDFSGYSDIAIGAARVMGFNLMKNFDRPYHSRNIHEFWKRWHISLSTWFKDYLYIPLGGKRVSKHRWYFNTIVVFLISGLWHGASWNFVIWGGLHGLYQITGILTKPKRAHWNHQFGFNKFPILLQIFDISFNFFIVTIAWIFFRVTSFTDAMYIVRHLFDIRSFSFESNTFKMVDLTIIALGILIMEFVHLLQYTESPIILISKQRTTIRWAAYLGIVLIILFLGKFDNESFIYFQF
jgi:alginate O-acetyltransferase complex protein AlgI